MLSHLSLKSLVLLDLYGERLDPLPKWYQSAKGPLPQPAPLPPPRLDVSARN